MENNTGASITVERAGFLARNPERLDHQIIYGLIPEGASVLDLGCGDGALLSLLVNGKKVRGTGIEIDEQSVRQCAGRGLSVSQQNIDCGLLDFNSGAFDFVILNQSLQQVVNLEPVLKETLRVGKNVIVGFPNFAYYKSRLQIFLLGRTPVTKSLPNMWYNTPNLHFLSISDFISYCQQQNIKIKRAVYLKENREIKLLPNLCALTGIFLLSGE
jgi:methionine biosynthesis protein MetW